MSDTPNKILAIKLRALGDLVLWTSSLMTLKKHYPNASIEVLIPEGDSHILKNEPYISKIHLIRKEPRFEVIKTLWRLRKEKYDLALVFNATPSLCRWIWLLGAKKSGLHLHSMMKKPFWSKLVLPEPGKLEDAMKRDFQLLRALDIQDKIPPTHLTVRPQLLEQARTRLKLDNENRFKLVMLPGAQEETHRYPKDQWLKAIDLILKDKQILVSVVADKTLSSDWKLRDECFKRGIKLFDDLSTEQLLAYVSMFDGAVANDSGPLHIAQALGLKTVALFGPSPVGDNHPYDKKRSTVLRQDVDCRALGPRDSIEFQYCTVKTCGHHTCMRDISSEAVAKAVSAMAQNYSSSAGAKRVPGIASIS